MCEILTALAYHPSTNCYQGHRMTIPSRPAPPPPTSRTTKTTNVSNGSTAQFGGVITTSAAAGGTRAGGIHHRYTPTTNWDDSPFATFGQPLPSVHKKPPPPRPPPPKTNPSVGLSLPALRKPGQQQSVSILSNLFGSASGNSSSAKRAQNASTKRTPFVPKLPAPPAASANHSSIVTGRPSGESLLIDFFSSPSTSPTLTQQSSSDCLSVDSFSSDSNCSPHNGRMSQAESGFEDDFGLDSWQQATATATSISTSTSTSISTFADPFDRPTMANGKPAVASKPLFYGSTGAPMRIVNPPQETVFDDPFCNGKSLLPPPSVCVAPTIIKPIGGHKSPQSTQTAVNTNLQYKAATLSAGSSLDLDDISLPMPSCPPPPPPASIATESNYILPEELGSESYGIALYDFEGEQDEDLCFRANEKIYLIRQMNDEWYFGRDKRGCEGIFPINFIDVRLPLQKSCTAASETQSHNDQKSRRAKALYDFNAQTIDDLTLKENDTVYVLKSINDEWLYGESANGLDRGQFPANFVEFL